jgi:hypothetical protein
MFFFNVFCPCSSGANLDRINLATVSLGTMVTSICQGGADEKSNPLLIQQGSKRSVNPSRLNFYSVKKLKQTGQGTNRLLGIEEEQANRQ